MGLGLRTEHPNSGQIRTELISPSGRRVKVLSGERDLGAGYPNYTVLLFDAAAAAVSWLEITHDLALPGFLHAARPDEPLSAFVGEQAAGTWTLVLCDANSSRDDGSYLESRLFLLPQNTAVENGSWFKSLALPELDGVEQTLTVYGLDNSGNRSSEPWKHTFVVDNVSPAFSVTEIITQTQMTPDLAPMSVLTGTVTDGGGVRRLFALDLTPEGQRIIQPVAHDGDGWTFALRTMSAGSHAILITAEGS